MRNAFFINEFINQSIVKQDNPQKNSQNNQILNENLDTPNRFQNTNSLRQPQKRQSYISSTSKTEQLSQDKYSSKTNNNLNQIRENILQIRDSSNKFIRLRDNSDPICGNRYDLNQILPKLNQNQDNQYNINLQTQERQNMNQKIYKVLNLQKQQLPNQSTLINDESKDNPQKEQQQQNNINEFRNIFNLNQIAKTNTGNKPISILYNDFSDPIRNIKFNNLDKMYNNDLQKQKIIESDIIDQNETQFAKKNNYKQPQFQRLTSYQKMQEQKQQIKQYYQGQNVNDDLQKISNILNINPLLNLNKDQEIKEENKNSMYLNKNQNLQLLRDQINYFSNQRNQIDSNQILQQQLNQNYEPQNEDQNQFNKSRKNFRILSGYRQKRTNSNLNLSQHITQQNNAQQQDMVYKSIKTQQDTCCSKDNQVLVLKNICDFERNILNEGDQIIQRINNKTNESQLQIKKQNDDKNNQILNKKQGQFMLQFNQESSKNQNVIETQEKSDKQNVDNQQLRQQSELQDMMMKLKNSNTQVQESKRNSRRLNNIIDCGEFDEQNEELEKQRSRLNSTDIALTNSDRMSQNTDKQKNQNIKSDQSSNNEQQTNFQNVLSDKTYESSIQNDSQDEILSDPGYQILNPFQKINQSVQNVQQQNQFHNKQKEFEKNSFQTQVKSQTQQSPRVKKEQKLIENMSDFSYLLNSEVRNCKQQKLDQKKQLNIQKKEIMNSLERNGSSKPQQRDYQQIKQQEKSSNNLDNNAETIGNISTNKIQQKNEGKLKNFKTPPEVSSKCWSVLNADGSELLYGKNQNLQAEIASLTKIMTCYVTISFFEENKLDLKKIFIEVSKVATKIGGTSANLVKGDFISTYELLYGLMLPSGNDAAVVLSEGVGYLLLRKQEQLPFTSEFSQSNTQGDENIYINYKCKQEIGGLNVCTASFLKEMNKYAKKLGLLKTNYACVHGLSNKQNKSTAKDVGLLSCIAMKNPLFQKVVNTQEYETTTALDPNKKNLDQYEWENTNQMLEYKGYDGVKTGVTDSAGPCLSSHYRRNRNGQQIKLICVLLNCKSMNHRWIETKKLISWSIKNFYPKKHKKIQDESIQSVQSPSQ